MWQSLEIFNIFSTLTLKQVFWKTKALFKKLKYRFLVEYYDQKHDISIQFFSVKNQCSNKLNGVYKMDPSQRTEFCHYGQLWLGFVLVNYLKFLKMLHLCRATLPILLFILKKILEGEQTFYFTSTKFSL